MSTTIKRIALVAVAALGLGVMTSAPSNAAPAAAYGSFIGDSATGQQEINSLATVVITHNETITEVTTSGVGSIVSAVRTTGDDAVVTTPAANGTFTITDNDVSVDTGTTTVTLTSTVAGVQTITMTPYTSTGARGTAVTTTVTWVASLSKNTYDKSLVYLTGDTTTVPSVVSADTNTAASATAAINVTAVPNITASKAAVWIKQFAVGDTTTTSTLATGKGKEVIVEISGAGSLGTAANQATGSVVTLTAASSGSSAVQVYVFSDGRTGTGTITVKVGGVLVATKTVAFTGTTTKYVLGTTTAELLSKKYLGVGDAAATVSFNGVDNNNNLAEAAPAAADFAITSDATIATATAVNGVVTINAVKAGKASIRVANAATAATATIISAPVEIEVTGTVAKTVTFSFDKAAYQPGEKITLSVNAVDANGRPVADGARALLKESATANMSIIGSLPGASVTLVDGKANYVLYAPSTSGDLVISATEGTATASTTKAAIAGGTVAVTNAGLDAALDAANEAATAAQDATDAAIQAADAADEATAAVAALSLEVNTLIAGLKKQLVTLTNLVKNLQKAVAAKK